MEVQWAWVTWECIRIIWARWDIMDRRMDLPTVGRCTVCHRMEWAMVQDTGPLTMEWGLMDRWVPEGLKDHQCEG